MSNPFLMIGALLSTFLLTNGFAEEDPLTPKEIQLNAQPEKKAQRRSPVVKAAFSPFTGKVTGDKVRMRLQPDLDGYIVRELTKNELLSIADQEGEYYCVQPPEALKAYVFRSFVLDNVVEGNRVNIRLEPHLEAPVIGHLNSGDRVEGTISSDNKKWLKIAPPANTCFYVSKEYIEHVGGPELKEKMALRKESVEQLLEAASLLAKNELTNDFEEINFDQIKEGFLTIIHDYTDFPRMVELSKEALAGVQEEYLQKRIDYLEQKAALASGFTPEKKTETNKRSGSFRKQQTTGQNWQGIENALYASWTEINDHKDKGAYYEEQKLVAASISGTVEAYNAPIKNLPGNYIVKSKNVPVAYVYSTQVDLGDYVGKQVTLIGSPRSNNNFAFPAYFVHEVQ